MTLCRQHLILVQSVIVLTGPTLFSCQSASEKPATVSTKNDTTNIALINPSNATYRQQLKNARDSMHFFTDLLQDKAGNRFEFFAKAAFADGEHVEHMWFSADSLVGNKIAGYLDNEPLQVKNVAYKNRVAINLMHIEDWAVYDRDSLIAGNFITYE